MGSIKESRASNFRAAFREDYRELWWDEINPITKTRKYENTKVLMAVEPAGQALPHCLEFM